MDTGNPGVEVRGAVVDSETRCIHHRTTLDVVAILFFCCRRWYPCLHCHAAAEVHPVSPWPADRHDAEALLCGVCRTTISITDYRQAQSCPGCGAGFNSRCAAHHPVYFDA